MKNDWIVWAGLGVGAFYLVSKLGKPVADVGDQVSQVTGDAANALSPWLKDVEMIGNLPQLIARSITKNYYMSPEQKAATVEEVTRKTSTSQGYTSTVATILTQNKSPTIQQLGNTVRSSGAGAALVEYATNNPVAKFNPGSAEQKFINTTSAVSGMPLTKNNAVPLPIRNNQPTFGVSKNQALSALTKRK